MRIREWKPEDIPKLVEAERRCFSDPWTEQMFVDVLKFPIYHGFLAEENGELCGYALLIVACEDADLANLAVDLPFRGRGVARALMDALLEQAKRSGATQCFLEVRVSNVAAISLYKKYGCEICGVRKRYYEDGEDAFLMKKSL